MKKLLLPILAIVVMAGLSGCERSEADKQRAHEIRMAKIESGQDLKEREMSHQRSMAYYGYSVPRPIGPVAPGAYIDYRGNPAYGYWGASGFWHWNDPTGLYAMQTRNYLNYQVATGVMTAALVGAALSRDDWDRDNRGGWSERNVTVNKYYSKDGKEISKNEYGKRNAAYTAKRDKWKTDRKKFRSSYEKKNPEKVAALNKKSAAIDKKRSSNVSKSSYAKGGSENTLKKPETKTTKPVAKPVVKNSKDDIAARKAALAKKKREREAKLAKQKSDKQAKANRFSNTNSKSNSNNRFKQSSQSRKKCTYKNGKKVCR